MKKIFLFILMTLFSVPAFAEDPAEFPEGPSCEKKAQPEVEKTTRRAAKKLSNFVKETRRLPVGEEWKQIQEEELPDLNTETSVQMTVIEKAKSEFGKPFEVAKNAYINAFIKASRRFGRTARVPELLKELKIPEDKALGVFSSGGLFADFTSLKNASMEKNPNAFKFVFDNTVFTPERTEAMLTAIKARRRMILTTVVAGAPVDLEFLEALKRYASENDAEIIVYPANMQTGGLDPILLSTPGVHILTNTVELSPWLSLDRIKIMPKQILPLTGLARLGPRGQSLIVGSPKMHMQTVPTAKNADHPHKLYTTGALSLPYYAGQLEISGRTDALAEDKHFMGALILEKSDLASELVPLDSAGDYHVRRVEFIPEKKGFMDLGRFYTGQDMKEIQPEALVLGDLHVGSTDQQLLAKLRDQVIRLKPKVIVIHDLLDGQSINHHERKKLMSLAQRAKEGKLNLENEIREVVLFLNSLLAIDSKLVIKIVDSNHDEWIARWLQDGQFMNEPQNTAIGLELANAMLKREDPFEYAVRNRGLEQQKRVKFIRSSESRVASLTFGPRGRQVETAFHGHVMANGARGSLPSAELGSDGIIFGHTHTLSYRGRAVNTGTLTEKILPYTNQGFSSWVQAVSLVGPNGEIQALEFRNGEWLSEEKNPPKVDSFFMPNYPFVVPNVEARREGQIDQWNRH